MVVAGMFLLALFATGVPSKPTRRESFGAFIGLLWCGADALGPRWTQQGDNTVTLLRGLTGVARGPHRRRLHCMCGRMCLRAWMPIFLYAFPVTLLGCGALLLPASMAGRGRLRQPTACLGWLEPIVLLRGSWPLALIAGLLGHTGLEHLPQVPLSAGYFCLRHPRTRDWFLHRLRMWRLAPIYRVGWTWIGGGVLMLGLMLIVTAVAQQARIRTIKRSSPTVESKREHHEPPITPEAGWLLLTNDDGIEAPGLPFAGSGPE